MKTAYCKLPPLPKRNIQLRIPSIQCQSISLQQKCNTVQDRSQRDEDYQFVQQKPIQKLRQFPRPSSKKSQKQSYSRSKSNESSKQRIYSHEKRKQVFISQVPPKITAKSWILYDMQQNKPLWSHRSHKRRQIASLTKMMNLITILELVNSIGIDPRQLKLKASKTAIEITGTTAQLRLAAEYTLYDLLYGMMLPSGNDAAWLIAELGGFLMKIFKDNLNHSLREINSKVNVQIQASSDQFVAAFLRQMNRMASKIQMNSSNFDNPHGLSNTNNYSTAEDLAKLCTYSMRNSIFRKIVQTKRYNYSIKLKMDKPDAKSAISTETIDDQKENYDTSEKQVKIVLSWQNTNKMLGEGWSGIKTGITPNAGPCLAASLARTLEGRNYEFLVILLESESMEIVSRLGYPKQKIYLNFDVLNDEKQKYLRRELSTID